MHITTESRPGQDSGNDDAFGVEKHAGDRPAWVAVLADGQGGRPGGKSAAQIACQTILDKALALPLEKWTKPQTWGGLLQHADQRVLENADAGFSTLVAVGILPTLLVGVSNGDSAGVLLDHEHRTHQLTAHQQKNPPVGSGGVSIVTFSHPLTQPWKLLLLSDGVWKYTGWSTVLQSLSTHRGQPLIDHLRQSAQLPRTGQLQDDFTAILLEAR